MATGKFVNSRRNNSGTFSGLETSLSGEDNDGPGVGYPKGWSSERVPSSSYRSRRHLGPAASMPFNSGRTLPSKWEDAERWICSPVSLGNISSNNTSSYCYYAAGGGSRTTFHQAQYQRRAKSKSGPLGPSGPVLYGGSYSSFSPVLGVGVINGGRWRHSLAIESPGLVSARFEERLGMEGGVASERRRSCPGDATWLDSWSGPTSPTQDELNINKDMNESMKNNLEQDHDNYNGDSGVDRAISRRDMATQMFPESQSSSASAISSPKSSVSTISPPQLPFGEPKRDVQSPEYEVKDVQVDKQTSTPKFCPGTNQINLRESDLSITSSAGVLKTDNKISKFKREEARINAWENLQKAKAEAAIQKLEEKLEKKRASSMDKIIQKLRRAEIKAHKMKSSIPSSNDQNDHETESRSISKTTSKIPSFCKKLRLISSVRSCSTCYLL